MGVHRGVGLRGGVLDAFGLGHAVARGSGGLRGLWCGWAWLRRIRGVTPGWCGWRATVHCGGIAPFGFDAAFEGVAQRLDSSPRPCDARRRGPYLPHATRAAVPPGIGRSPADLARNRIGYRSAAAGAQRDGGAGGPGDLSCSAGGYRGADRGEPLRLRVNASRLSAIGSGLSREDPGRRAGLEPINDRRPRPAECLPGCADVGPVDRGTSVARVAHPTPARPGASRSLGFESVAEPVK